MKNLFYLITAISILAGCTKNKPKVGEYEAWFYGSYIKNGQTYTYDRNQKVSIVDVNENSISLSIYNNGYVSSILDKKDKIVSGIFNTLGGTPTGGPSYPSQEINITGSWEKHSGKYSISGFHQWIYTDIDAQNQTINEYIVSGKFEIKSK